MIKYLVVTLAQVPMKSVMMYVVVVDVPENYGMLLSRSWGDKLEEIIRLYREEKVSYTMSDP